MATPIANMTRLPARSSADSQTTIDGDWSAREARVLRREKYESFVRRIAELEGMLAGTTVRPVWADNATIQRHIDDAKIGRDLYAPTEADLAAERRASTPDLSAPVNGPTLADSYRAAQPAPNGPMAAAYLAAAPKQER